MDPHEPSSSLSKNDEGAQKNVTTIETIRKVRLDYRKGVPRKQIARDRGINVKVVRKILDKDITEITYSKRQIQPHPKLEGFMESLEEMLSERMALPKKQRCKITRIFENLEDQGYEGGYDAVRRYAKKWEEQQERTSHPQACTPLKFSPGEAFQFDWSPEFAIIDGVPTRVHLACLTLAHSRVSFVRAYPRETMEMVMDAHALGFEFFGGVCERGIYDNMKTAVIKILKGKDRNWNKNFIRLCSHYAYDPDPCSPNQPQEKGRVERALQSYQEYCFRPAPKFDSFDALNDYLEEECLRRARERPHPEVSGKSCWDVFLDEKKSLHKVSKRFNACVDKSGKVGPTQLVRYDRNHYSAPANLVNQHLDLRIYADRIVLVHNDSEVSKFKRVFGEGVISTEIEHYIPTLERKPGTLNNGIPFEDERLPQPLLLIWRHLKEKHDDADRQFVEILCSLKDHSMDELIVACELAIENHTCSKAVVLNHLHRVCEETSTTNNAIPEGLLLEEPPCDDCSIYDQLIG